MNSSPVAEEKEFEGWIVWTSLIHVTQEECSVNNEEHSSTWIAEQVLRHMLWLLSKRVVFTFQQQGDLCADVILLYKLYAFSLLCDFL